MNIGYVIIGLVMICLGILIVIFQIKWYKKELEDPYGHERNLTITGFFLIALGIGIVVKDL